MRQAPSPARGTRDLSPQGRGEAEFAVPSSRRSPKQNSDMRLRHRVDVEVIELVKQPVPYNADQHRRDDELRKARERIVRQLAALGGTPQNGTDNGEHAPD